MMERIANLTCRETEATGAARLKMALHIPALVKYPRNDNALALKGKNQDMLFDDQAFIAFRYVVPAVANFRVFRQQFHAAMERFQVNINLSFAMAGKGILGNIP